MAYNGRHLAQLAVDLDAVFEGVGRKAQLPAFSVDIDVAGARLSRAYRDGGKLVTGEDRPTFQSGCLMDIFLPIVCLDMHVRRGLDLDAPYWDIVPELKPLDADAPVVTIRHLLMRTSGLQEPRDIVEMRTLIPWEELSDRVRDTRRLFSPGAVFNYGGIDRVILLVLLQRFGGKLFGRLAREAAVEPVGIPIREVQFGPAEADGFRPIETFDTSTLLTIAALLARQGGGSDNPFAESLRNALQIERLQLSRSVQAQPWPHAPVAFTYGLFKYSDGLLGFNGWEQNQSCAVRFDPASEVSFVVALEGPPHVRDVVVGEIADRLGYHSLQARAMPCTVGGLNGLSPRDIEGRYEGWADGYVADVRLNEGELSCDLSYRGDLMRRLRVRLEEEAWLVADSVAHAGALEFFQDPRRDVICMATGFLPYSKPQLAA